MGPLFFVKKLGIVLNRIDTKHPENGFFLVATITSGVNANCRELTTFAPALNSESGDTKKLGDFRDR